MCITYSFGVWNLITSQQQILPGEVYQNVRNLELVVFSYYLSNTQRCTRPYIANVYVLSKCPQCTRLFLCHLLANVYTVTYETILNMYTDNVS